MDFHCLPLWIVEGVSRLDNIGADEMRGDARFWPKADILKPPLIRHHNTRRSAPYFRVKGTNRTGAALLVVAVPSGRFANTMSC